MNRFGACLLLALSATVLSGQSGDEPAENQITIYTRFDRLPSSDSIDQMKIELESIILPLGLRLDWRRLDSATGREVLAEILVVNFKGACQCGETIPRGRSGALGWTHVSEGEVLPFTDVDCDSIKKLMRAPLTFAPLPQRDRLLGKAMARVLAHEMYHFLTNTTRHAATGIAKPFFGPAELACPHLGFEDAQIRHVQKSRLKYPLGAVQATAQSPAGSGSIAIRP